MVPTLVDEYGEASATIAAQWCEDMRALQVEGSDYIATAGDMFPSEAVQQSIRWNADSLWDDEEQMQRFLRNSVDRWVKYSGRSTIMQNASRDPKKVRYALVPRGKTCAWCTMIASRDFVYSSEANVKAAQHAHCDCWPCPMWDAKKAFISGYDPEQMEKDYQAARDELVKVKKGTSLYSKEYRRDKHTGSSEENDIAWLMRRLKPYDYTDGTNTDPRYTKDNSLSYAKHADYRESLRERFEKAQNPEWKLPPEKPVEAPADWPEDLPVLKAKTWNHVLYGDGYKEKNPETGQKEYSYNGGHLNGYGWVADRPEFPDTWDANKIAQAAQDILHNTELGDTNLKKTYKGSYDGIDIKISIDKGAITSIYPLQEVK